MPDDWSWFWAGESGRDNLLRDELEGLQSRAVEASQQSARLSSQLRTLQGSIESRLQALSTAFDAYVELGDVREQLAGYPDTSAVRRQALRVLAVLEQGGAPDPLGPDDAGYWLAGATDEVIALAGGTPTGEHTGTSASGAGAGTEHETYVVAALGWLGHGERVASRVAPLLLGDGALAAPQVVLWRALVHGRFPGALPAVRDAWARDLDQTAPTWDRFAQQAARSGGPAQTLHWVQDLVRGGWSPGRAATRDAAAVDPDDDRVALRRVVEALVGIGLGDERALLERARVLRARIEDPGAPEPDLQHEPPRTPTTVAVQEALLDPRVPAEVRRELVAWVRPGLDAAVSAVAAGVAAQVPGQQTVHTEMGQVAVSTQGADAARLAELDGYAVERHSRAPSRRLVPAVGAAVALLAGLAFVATDLAGLGVLLLVVAGALAIVLVREVFRARTARTELEGVRQRTRQRVEEGRQTAVAVERASLETKAEVAALARSITDEAALR